MPLVGVKANAGAFGLGWSAVLPGEELGGMVLLTPTSIAYTGGGSETATIGANGSVEFSACESLSLNGVFSADYDNYMISVRQVGSTSNAQLYLRLRASGTDNSTANSYTYQYLSVDSTTVSGARTTTNQVLCAGVYNVQRDGVTHYLYGPYLAQPTAGRTVNVLGLSSGYIYDAAYTHNQSTSYDGFSLYPSTGSFSGLVSVYGLVGA